MAGGKRPHIFDMAPKVQLGMQGGRVIGSRPAMPEEVKLSLFPECIEGRSDEEIAEIESLLASMHPVKEATCVIRRHKFPQKVGSVYVPQTAKEIYDKRTVTGTVLKMRLSAENSFLDKNGNVTYPEFKVGDYVLFTQYAPFFAYEKFPDLQVIHAEDVLFRLESLPPGVEDRW